MPALLKSTLFYVTPVVCPATRLFQCPCPPDLPTQRDPVSMGATPATPDKLQGYPPLLAERARRRTMLPSRGHDSSPGELIRVPSNMLVCHLRSGRTLWPWTVCPHSWRSLCLLFPRPIPGSSSLWFPGTQLSEPRPLPPTIQDASFSVSWRVRPTSPRRSAGSDQCGGNSRSLGVSWPVPVWAPELSPSGCLTFPKP